MYKYIYIYNSNRPNKETLIHLDSMEIMFGGKYKPWSCVDVVQSSPSHGNFAILQCSRGYTTHLRAPRSANVLTTMPLNIYPKQTPMYIYTHHTKFPNTLTRTFRYSE